MTQEGSSGGFQTRKAETIPRSPSWTAERPEDDIDPDMAEQSETSYSFKSSHCAEADKYLKAYVKDGESTVNMGNTPESIQISQAAESHIHDWKSAAERDVKV